MTTRTRSDAPSRPKPALSLDMTIKEYAPRTPAKKLAQLEKLGITTVRDLLTNMPRGYENRSRITPARAASEDERQTFEGYITAVRNTQSGRGPGRQAATIHDTLEDLENRRYGLPILWFGQAHLVNTIQPGDYIRLNGTVNRSTRNGYTQLYQPEIDILTQKDGYTKPAINTGAIVPIYHLTSGMNQPYIRRITRRCLEDFEHRMVRSRPGKQSHSLSQIFWTIHFPQQEHHPQLAIQELASDEVLELQMALLQRRQHHQSQGAQKPLMHNLAVAAGMHQRLPFTLSPSQNEAIDQIRHDLMAHGPTMNRLLQGEVGSGKTVVALSTALDVASAGCQTTFLAPTELLAEQHHNTIADLMHADQSSEEPALMQAHIDGRSRPFHFALLTSSTKARERRRILQNLAMGYVDLIIGTHSLLSPEVEFKDLGLAIADEQHRFGTKQRAALRQQAHYLMLTATPIPRTLQLTLYRDLDISSIARDRPETTTPTVTDIIMDARREHAWQELERQVADGRQAFVVCPFIEKADIPGMSVSELTPIIKNRFPDLNVDTIHGRMKTNEQDRHMRAFRDGETDVLISTQIIEVGIDIPNATVMMIESAERFGMAQLHQLRGRIGRGKHPGTCYLITTPGVRVGDVALTRLETAAASNNGLELAEADLHNRGEGQIAGNRQSGRGGILRTGSSYDLPMLEMQREIAETIHQQDPTLSNAEHHELNAATKRMLHRMEQDASQQ